MSRGIIDNLRENFGAEHVKICTEYHVQVASPRGPHNIWITNLDILKLQLCGCRQIIKGIRLKNLVKKIKDYSFTQSERAMMEDALKLTKFINQAIIKRQNGVYVDAGWKDGKGKVAVIFIDGDHISAESFCEAFPNCLAAELRAIEFGTVYNPFKIEQLCAIPIYTDCKAAIGYLEKEGKLSQRLKWISREKNASDKIGNMRSRNEMENI